jgi:maltooligosyltrehalose trehalohydrolase
LAYTSTHDQVGNRALGDRRTAYLTDGQLAVSAALALLTPFTAMLFMGEEWAATTPFQFFSSHPEPELAEATRQGRKAEFADHGWDAAEVPDPQDPETFLRSKLNWDEAGAGRHAAMLALYRELIALRRTEPDLADYWLDHLAVDYDEDARWIVLYRGTLAIACNLGADTASVPVTGELVYAWGTPRVGAVATALDGHSFAVLRVSAPVR